MTSKRLHRRLRRGNIVVLTAFLMVGLMGLIAFAVDLGYLYNARTEMQRAVDSSAIAGCWELIDTGAASGTSNPSVLSDNARTKARLFASYNLVTRSAAQLAADDISVGYIANPADPNSPFLSVGYTGSPNAMQIHMRRTAQQNGVIPLFFGPVLGVNSASMDCYATAAYMPGISGFKSPSDGSNLGILPYALDEETWNGMLAGGGSDDYRHSDASGLVSTGPDGIREVNLFPQGTGSPGNRGTVDIGPSNNSTSDIARQIVYGISASDMSYMPNGKLQFGSDGTLTLNGDTGISAGVKDELASIIGDTRIIPIFRSVTGNGNNANYTIVKFVGIRMMYVKLTGSNKQVMVQPAVVTTRGGLSGSTSRSDYIYSPVWLVR
jgi:hypothetical protein